MIDAKARYIAMNLLVFAAMIVAVLIYGMVTAVNTYSRMEADIAGLKSQVEQLQKDRR